MPFRVLIDGQPPGDAHGLDVDAEGQGAVVEPRLYQLVRQRESIADRTFEIEFSAPGSRPTCSPSASDVGPGRLVEVGPDEDRVPVGVDRDLGRERLAEAIVESDARERVHGSPHTRRASPQDLRR